MKSPNCGEGAFGGNPCLAPPHVRGEDNAKTGQARPERETPPRAWGRLFPFFPFGPYDRNTPTCVGKTYTWRVLLFSREKHPHVRGEDREWLKQRDRNLETPPRAWGRPSKLYAFFLSARNTPTCVGKTTTRAHWKLVEEKHPHVRGEDLPSPPSRRANAETPPRAWGRLTRPKSYGNKERNTPTCVGKTSAVACWIIMRGKHPHVRGEDI